MHRTLKWLAVITSVWMFFVLLGGALVTKKEAGEGCGDDWPLCNGKFVPAYTIESMIEYSHRVVSGIVGLLVLAVFIWVVWKVRARKDIILYASTALFFTVLQAALGAMAVMSPQSSAVMALHFGFSLTAFAATLLLAIAIARLDRKPHVSGWGEDRLLGGPGVHVFYQWLVWFTTALTYAVVYVGAFVVHTESWAGCQGWPLCNGQVIPELTGPTGIAFGHRLTALLLFLVLLWMCVHGWRHYGHIRELRISGYWALGLTILQNLSGALVVFTMTDVNGHLFSSMLHTVLVAGLFGILCYMSVTVWQLRR